MVLFGRGILRGASDRWGSPSCRVLRDLNLRPAHVVRTGGGAGALIKTHTLVAVGVVSSPYAGCLCDSTYCSSSATIQRPYIELGASFDVLR